MYRRDSRRTINDIMRMESMNMADKSPRKADDKQESREVENLAVSMTADVSDVLTGLKAVQRELRETTKAVREYETAMDEAEIGKRQCGACIGSGFVSIGDGIRGVTKCDACRGGGKR